MISPTTLHWPHDLTRAGDLTRLAPDELLRNAGAMKAEQAVICAMATRKGGDDGH